MLRARKHHRDNHLQPAIIMRHAVNDPLRFARIPKLACANYIPLLLPLLLLLLLLLVDLTQPLRFCIYEERAAFSLW